MKAVNYSWRQVVFYLVLALIALALLVFLPRPGVAADPLATAIFAALVAFATFFGIPFYTASVSLAHMVTMAAMLALGPIAAGWAAFIGAGVNDLVRSRTITHMRPSGTLLAVLGQNLFMQTSSILAAGFAFLGTGGRLPLTNLSLTQIGPLLAGMLVYILVNNSIFALYTRLNGQRPWQHYRQNGWRVALIEAVPLVVAPLVTVTYTRLGGVFFNLTIIVLAAVVLITQQLALALQALERRAQTLASLNAVGQALSSNLHLDDLLLAVHEQVSHLMEAENLYVALLENDGREVSFPLAIENGERIDRAPRPMTNSLTGYVIRTRSPLLLQGDAHTEAAKMGIAAVGSPALAWLGVPLILGDQVLGVLAVQSRTNADAYDREHQETLLGIASQTAVAIANAQRYELADQTLAQRVRELSAVLDASQDGILLLDAEGLVLMANPALANLTGVPLSELEGQSVFEQSRPDGRCLLELLGYSPDTFRADLSEASEGPGQRLEQVFELETEQAFARSLTAVNADADNILGWLLLLRDVTHERELAKMREDMTSMVIHDLRSPLSSVLGGADLLLDMEEDPDSTASRVLSIIQRSGQKMLELINSLLDISRLENGRMPLELGRTSLAQVTLEITNRLSPAAQKAEIALMTNLPDDLPLILADRDQLGRVLLNLVDNAINHSPDGDRIEIWAHADETSVTVGVNDNGPGIPAEDLPQVFEKFRQAKQHASRRKGSGLGLAFCRLAVEAMGGHIWAESQMGKGSSFIFSLPRAND